MNKRVLIVGGSEDFTGAVYLAGITTLRSGSESVLLMTPEKVAWAINALSPDLMTEKLSGKFLSTKHQNEIEEKLKTADILLIGNGVTTDEDSLSLMKSLIKWDGIKVVDADALKAIENNDIEKAILTPNPNEWDILNGKNDIPAILDKGNVIIKKGSPTITLLSSGKSEEIEVSDGLHKAGMGDVLAGLCAGYLAQGLSLIDAAKEAIKTGNEVADILTEKKEGYYFLASDIANEIQSLHKQDL